MNDCLGAIKFCLAAFGAPVIRILAAAVGSEIILGADKGPGLFDNPFDLSVQFYHPDRLAMKSYMPASRACSMALGSEWAVSIMMGT